MNLFLRKQIHLKVDLTQLAVIALIKCFALLSSTTFQNKRFQEDARQTTKNMQLPGAEFWTSYVENQALVPVRQQLLEVIFIIMASLFDI